MKSRTTLLITLILCSVSFAKYSGGNGEPNNPYQIATPNDLNSIGLDSNDWDKHFLMTADINMAGVDSRDFPTIGFWNKSFTGTFDGNDNTISNFTYSLDEDCMALFAYTDVNCVIKNLTLYKPNISGDTRVAGLVARCRNASISNCHIVSGKITGGNIVAGLIGQCDSGEIINCSSIADVNCGNGDFAGGLIAVNDGNISRCFAKGSVYGYIGVGGLIGASNSGVISDCYADVKGNHDGGFIGFSGPDLEAF